jgi:gliding motility-associated-like protein
LDLGPDLELGLGELATIQAISNLSPAQIDTLIWSPANGITCIDVACLEVTLQPSNTINLEATLIDLFGCEVTDVVFVKLDKRRKVYIPNTFSPNGDGINDIFTVFADQDQVAEIKSFAIYSRWGEVIHDLPNFQPNDPAYGWDGTFDGEIVNPGVFVYRVEVEFIDDVTEIYTGTVSIIK